MSWPPDDTEAAEQWAYDNPLDAVRYAAMWSHGGIGYGSQAEEEWPDCPGFDWDDGLPDWGCELTEDSDYEYRTVLVLHWTCERDVPGWEFVAVYQVNPEPELYDSDGSPCGYMYIGEHSAEVVYRRRHED